MALLNRWLIRLSYSFLILAGLLGWKTYKQVQSLGWSSSAVLVTVGAVVAAGVGFWGVRARHRWMVEMDRQQPVDGPNDSDRL